VAATVMFSRFRSLFSFCRTSSYKV